MIITRVMQPVGMGSLIVLAVMQELPITITPTINLVAILCGAVWIGVLSNRVSQLERRMNKVDKEEA